MNYRQCLTKRLLKLDGDPFGSVLGVARPAFCWKSARDVRELEDGIGS